MDHEKKVTSPSPFVSSTQAKAALRPKQKRGERENKKGEEEEKQPSGLSSTSFSDLHARPLPPPPKAERRNEHGCSFSRARKIPLPSPPLLSLFPLLPPPLRYPAGDASVTNPSPFLLVSLRVQLLFSRQSVSPPPPQTLSLPLPPIALPREGHHTEKRGAFTAPFLPPNSHSLLLLPLRLIHPIQLTKGAPPRRTDGRRETQKVGEGGTYFISDSAFQSRRRRKRRRKIHPLQMKSTNIGRHISTEVPFHPPLPTLHGDTTQATTTLRTARRPIKFRKP